MNNNNEAHPTEKLFAYIEGALDTQEHKLVQEHADECKTCSATIVEYKALIAGISDPNNRVFCPPINEMITYLENNRCDDTITSHLNSCKKCSSELNELAAAFDQPTNLQPLPSKIKAALQSRKHFKTTLQDRISNVIQEVIDFFKLKPAFSLASAAAFVLAILIIMPGKNEYFLIQPSQISWNTPETRIAKSLMGPKQPTVATMILTKGRTPSVNTDELFQIMQPGPDLVTRFNFVSPNEIAGLMDISGPVPDISKISMKLKDNPKITYILYFTIEPRGHKIELKSSLYNLRSSEVLANKAETVSDLELKTTLKSNMHELLDQANVKSEMQK